MMKPTFQELIGSEVLKTKNGEATATLQMRDVFLNGLGIAHGGFHYHLCTTAIKAAVGAHVQAVESSIEYYSPINSSDIVRAVGQVDKDGRNFVYAHANLYVGEKPAAFMSAILLRSDSQIASGEVKVAQAMLDSLPVSAPSVELTLEGNICDCKFTGTDEFLKKMFCYSLGSEIIDRLKGSMSITAQPDERYADESGAIDASFFGIMADSTLGLTSFSGDGKTVTMKLMTQLYKKVEPSTKLRFRADVVAEIDRLVYVNGSIRADESLVGSCSGVFCKVI